MQPPPRKTIEAAAEHLGLPVSTLRFWRLKGTGPKSFTMGRRVFYAVEDLDAWVSAQYASAA